MLTADDREERDLRIELMKAQIDHTRVDMAKLAREMRWEPYKAIAVLLGATAAWGGAILALAAWLAPRLHG